MSINQEFPAGLSVPNIITKPKLVLPPVDPNTRIDVNDPKAHIMNLFPDLFEGVGTMEKCTGTFRHKSRDRTGLSKHQEKFHIV